MRIEGEEQSENVEDRRRGGGGRAAGGIGLLGILLVLGISLLTGKDPTQLLRLMQQTGVGVEQSVPAPGGPPVDDQLGVFASQVLRSTEKVWDDVFREMRGQYEVPRLVLF